MDNIKEALRSMASDMDVLYVEDEVNVRKVFENALLRYFKKVSVAKDGVEALELFKQRDFDIVITDIAMPNMDGKQLCEEIKKIDEDKKIAVISAHSDSERLLEFINLGVDAFLVKPVRSDVLLKMLYKVVKQTHDTKMAIEFEQKIMDLNKELEAKVQALNKALKRVIKAENIAITAIEKHDEIKKGDLPLKIRRKVMSAEDFHELMPYDTEEKTNVLENIEDEFDIVINRLKNGQVSSYEELANVFRQYGAALGSYHEFQNIAFALEELANALVKNEHEKMNDATLSILYAISDNLRNFRESIFVNRSAKDIHYLDESLVADITILERFISGAGGEYGQDDDSDLELF